MNTKPEQQLNQQNAINFLYVALMNINEQCKDPDYQKFINGLSIFARPLEAILSDLEKVKF